MDGIFLDLGAQYYLIPDFADSLAPDMAERYGVSGGLIKPYPGFRAGIGCQWRNWRFSLESGYTYIKGDNPLVLDIDLVPLTFKAGYVFSPWKALSITPTLGAGLVFASVNHYETAIDMLLGNRSRSSNTGLLLNAGVRLGWSFIPALGLFAGAGLDCVVESGGVIPLPAVELGLTIKPFLFGKKAPAVMRGQAERPARTERIPEPVEAPEPEIPVEIPAMVSEPKPVMEEEAEAEAVRIVRTLYFPAEADVPVRSHLVELDAAAEPLRASPELGVTLRGYAAPYGNRERLLSLSERRALFCADYLEKEHGIARERITVEWYGAEELPETADGEDWRRRCVEIIVEQRADSRE